MNGQTNFVINNSVAINFPTEEKTEFVILGGDEDYSISNSDNTKLSISDDEGNLELTPLAPGEVVVTISDGSGNSYLLNVQIIDRSLKLKATRTQGNIFDLMEFNMYSEEEFTSQNLIEIYDSVVWVCTNTNQRLQILESSGHGSRFISKWSNCFFLPAEYETCLLGYKNNRVISADTVSVSIVNDKDFLGYNWSDVVNTSTVSTGYQNAFIKGYDFATRSVVTDNGSSLHLFLFQTNSGDGVAFAQKSRQVLLNYINSLYSAPTYSFDVDNSLSEIYNQLFRNTGTGVTPEYIWITPKSNMALIKKYDENAGVLKYEIHAEPGR
ncbi:hypothetical protein [Mariniphaga anaerophila]|nr:hypothetical protein [Mariniphaga anaerophila]